MQNKLTLKEYANIKNISLVTLNNWIKKDLVNSIKDGSRRYIVVKDGDVNKPLEKINKDTLDYKPKDIIKEYKSFNKILEKRNKQLYKLLLKKDTRINELENEVKKLNSSKNNLLLDYVAEMKKLYIPTLSVNTKEDEIIEAEPIKKKKKKSKKGGKTK